MRGDWMDEARRFEDIDKAVMKKFRIEHCTVDHDHERNPQDCIFVEHKDEKEGNSNG